MLSFAKFIGLLVAATTFIPIAIATADPVALQVLARREVVDYANGLMVDGMNIVGRQAASTVTVTVTVSDCGAFSSVPFATTTSDTTTATKTVQTTISTTAVPVPGSAESSTTPTTTVGSTTDTISGSGGVPAGTGTTPAPTAPASATPALSETPTTAPPTASSAASSSFTETFFGDTSSISLPPSPTGSSSFSTTSRTAPTGGAALPNFDVIGAMAAVGVAAFAVY